jgi:ABC-2 type transport system ATP-binding protein
LSALVEEAVQRSERLAAAPPAVVVDDVSKTFQLPHQKYSTLKERALHPLRSRTFDALHAVDEVSVTVRQGEFFGIVGRNGSGKSTLLKCLASIYQIDKGRIEINGRLSPFIELGVGFNPDLTALDNVVINGVMLGLSRREARKRFEEIIAFAELEEFLGLKLKNYSSGMSVRLAFSTAIQVDADILLVDEVLAVGDAAFQQKCYEQFQRMKDEGRTIIFVTHDMGAVERFCDRAMLLERGRIVQTADPRTIALAYNELNFGRLVHSSVEGERYGDHATAEIVGAWFESGGERVMALAQSEAFEAVVEIRFHTEIEDPVFAITLRNEAGHTLFSTSTQWHDTQTGRFEAGDSVQVRVGLDGWLAPSHYKLTPSVARAGGGADALDVREDLASLMIHATRVTGGVVDPPHTIDIRRL